VTRLSSLPSTTLPHYVTKGVVGKHVPCLEFSPGQSLLLDLYVKPHSLQLELWSKRAPTLIGNTLGKMLDIDEKILTLDRTSMAKICMEMNLEDRLSDVIAIQVGNRSYHQERDDRISHLGVAFVIFMVI
jgi:hypothetical protein